MYKKIYGDGVFMKTAIVYYSAHHGNTKKLLDAIAESNDVTLIDITKDKTVDISQYDRIGFASGIYYASFAKQLLTYAEEKLPNGKDVFYIATYSYLWNEKAELLQSNQQDS